jgi:dTDP-4-amino-4,6-dideoxygalactose transaminase
MCALLLDIRPGDEVIVPSYTFVSTALAFVRQGAKIVFADSRPDHPGIDEDKIEELITSRTRAIVPVHYAGVACDMDKIMDIANRHDTYVVEDAAQAIDSYYIPTKLNESKPPNAEPRTQNPEPGTRNPKPGTRNQEPETRIAKRPLGSIGHLATFSFHETKNINSGEGGLLAINDERFVKRAEIVWEKGTNRAEFFRGEVNRYGWVDIGSSFLPAEIIAAYLWAQIENLEKIQSRRKKIWELYYDGLKDWSEKTGIGLPITPSYATKNGHLFYLVCRDLEQRTRLIHHLKRNGIESVFHYLSLHQSPYYIEKHDGRELVNANRYADCLVRLPLFYDLSDQQIQNIITGINQFNS